MQYLIANYIEDKKLAWSETTLKTEAARLASHARLLPLAPEEAWAALQSLKPYTRVTTWTRMCQFVDWAIANGHLVGPNQFVLFREKNARLFKNAYVKKPADISFSEAIQRISQITKSASKRLALELLYSGLRFSERSTLSADGFVIGKGNKKRKVYVPPIEGPEFTGTHHEFWRDLQPVGLTPHMLRKIAMTRLAELGADGFELCEVAGWASIQTAMSYVRATKTKQLMEKMQNVG